MMLFIMTISVMKMTILLSFLMCNPKVLESLSKSGGVSIRGLFDPTEVDYPFMLQHLQHFVWEYLWKEDKYCEWRNPMTIWDLFMSRFVYAVHYARTSGIKWSLFQVANMTFFPHSVESKFFAVSCRWTVAQLSRVEAECIFVWVQYIWYLI